MTGLTDKGLGLESDQTVTPHQPLASKALDREEPFALADITDPDNVIIIEMNESAAKDAERIGVQIGDVMNGKGATNDINMDGLTKYQQLAAGLISEYKTEAVFFDNRDKPILFSVIARATGGPGISPRKFMRVTWSEQEILLQNPHSEPSDVIELAHALTTGSLADAAIGAALIDSSSKRYVALNHAYAELIGFERADLIGAPISLGLQEDFGIRDSMTRAGDILAGDIDSFTITTLVPEDPLIERTITIGAAERRVSKRRYLVAYVTDSPIESEFSWRDQNLSLRSLMATDIPENIYTYALIDHDWRLQFIVPEPEKLVESDVNLLGFSVLPNVHPSDLAAFLLVGENVRSGESAKTTLHLRFRAPDAQGGYFSVEATFDRPTGMPSGWLSVASRASISSASEVGFEERLAAITQAVINEEPREEFLGNPINARGIQRLVDAHRLTERERQIISLLADGYRVQTMSRTLHLSNGTIRNYLSAIFHKVGVRSQTELMEIILGDQIGNL